MLTSIVIATRNRPEPLRECLESLAGQTELPGEVIVVDSSPQATACLVADVCNIRAPFPIRYQKAAIAGAAVQRNEGVLAARGDLLFFLDDDVVLEPGFVGSVMDVFRSDPTAQIAGVGGLITNQHYSELSPINRTLLTLCVGSFGHLAGRVVGPGVNFLPADGPLAIQQVDWLLSGSCAYRRHEFLRFGFPSTFTGYSLAEDVFLSCSVAKTKSLVVTTKARLFHKDLGKTTHTNLVAFGEMAILNRHALMTIVLERTSIIDYLRLILYEFGYQSLVSLYSDHSFRGVLRLVHSTYGKLRGLTKIVIGRSPHRDLRSSWLLTAGKS